MNNVYIDKDGYLRFKNNNQLVHRYIAYKYVYKKMKLPLNFSKYQIHHKDWNKLHNSSDNLEPIEGKIHQKLHGWFKAKGL